MESDHEDFDKRMDEVQEQIKLLQQKLREGLVQVLKSCQSKDEQKAVLKKLGIEKARLIIDYALPTEDYEICQVAKEVVEELENSN